MPGQNRTDPHEFLWSTVMGTFHQKKSQAEMKPDTCDKPKIVCLAWTQEGCEPVGYCSRLSYSSLMSVSAENLPVFCVPHAVPCSDYSTVGSPFLCGAGEEPSSDAEMTRPWTGLRTGRIHRELMRNSRPFSIWLISKSESKRCGKIGISILWWLLNNWVF